MSRPLFTVLFPDGTTEYRTLSRAPPALGDVIPHLGESLVVENIGADPNGNTIVTLRHPVPIPGDLP